MKALKRNNDGVTHASIDMLCALMCVSIKLQILSLWNVHFRLLKGVETGPALHLAACSDNLLRRDFLLNLT